MQPEEYPHTPIPPFSPSRTVGSPPASHLSASVLSHVGSLRAPVFSAAGGAALAEGMHAAHHSPLRSSVHPLGLHLPAPTPAWASGLANIALERPSSTVAVPTDSADKPIALSLQSKLHGFQCILDNQAHLIKQLRREVDGKQETVEATRAAETVAALTASLRELGRVVEGKAGTQDVSAKLDELAAGLSRTLDSGEINARLLRCCTKAELAAEVSTRAAVHDVKNWLGSKADAGEVERAFDRQHAQTQAMQIQMETSLASEMDARRQALVLLRESLVSEISNTRSTIEQKTAKALEDSQHATEEAFQSKLEAAMAREAKSRQAELASLQDSLRMELHTQEKALRNELADEVHKRQAATAALREVVEENHKLAAAEPKAAHALARAQEEIADLKAELAHALGKKADGSELAALAEAVPTRQEVQVELNRKPSEAELTALLEGKADRADVKTFFERQSGAYNSLQEKVDSGLAAEAEARRKGDGAARDLVLNELEGFKHDLEQLRSIESQQTRQELAHMHGLVRDEMSAEAAARQQSLDSVRKHVGDELKATQRSVIGKLEKTDKDLAAHEQAVAKLERALAMVKEDVKGERESRDALKMTLSHGIEAVGQEVEAAAAEAARVEKRLRADVDHSLQQLATELNTETELRTKRLTELASDVSQLHSQADELTTAVARTRAMVMEEAIEKLNGVRREVDAVHSEMSMRPTKNELKAALDTVGGATASALTELRQHAEHKEEVDKVEHAALVDGLQKLREETAASAEKAGKATAAVAEKAEAATQKLAVAAHADVEKARQELAAAVQAVADAVEAECVARRRELSAAVATEAEARKRALGNADAVAEAEAKAHKAALEEVGHKVDRTASELREEVGHKVDRTAAELREEVAKEARARAAAAAEAAAAEAAALHEHAVLPLKALEVKMETRLAELAATAAARDEELLKQVEARAPKAVIGEVVDSAVHNEKRAREAALEGVHAEFTARLMAEGRAREAAVDRLEELSMSRSRATALDVRTEMVADTSTRFDALKAQVNGLDHKLGSLLIEEELKMKDSLIHALKVLKDELQHEIFNTQERVDTLMRMVEEKADVGEVTDHLLDIQRSLTAKADRAEKNKVKNKAKVIDSLVAGVPTGFVADLAHDSFPPPLRGSSARKAPWKAPDPAPKSKK